MNKLLSTILLFTVVISSVLWTSAHAAEGSDKATSDAWQSIQTGDAVILMRHALAPGTGDPAQFELDDCSTQRNLSEEGRAQAKRIGNVLRSNGINSASVLSSEWCRCLETAELLGLGKPEKASMLNSFYQDRSTADAQTSQLRSTISDWISTDKRVRILVTHQVNISALTGEFARSGEMLFVTFTGDEAVVLATLATPEI